MKKTATAGLALAASTLALAQSTVTVYGTVDLYVAHAKSGAASSTRLEDGGQTASRIGFRGTEDLGGGLGAHFTLESGFAPDTGNGTLPGPAMSFSRQSFVGFSAPWGQIDAGRMYTPMFYALFKADPYGLNSVFSPINLVAATDAQTGITPFAARASNMVRYRTPASMEFFADLAYAPGESSALSHQSGNVYGGNVGWARKPYYIAYAFQRARSGSAAAPVASPATTTYQALTGSYELPSIGLQLYASYVRNASSLPNVPTAKLVNLGATYNVTPTSNLIFGATQRKVAESERSQLAWTLGYDYYLSKRTVVYARWLRLLNRHGASASLGTIPVIAHSGNDVRVLATGIRHNF
ncbi:porin [Variovorax paradoxus]|uniref:Porin n=1 Tax=Variovorax paradoxus TaxID=34073 RepID=A0A5Q0M0T6_VARPD|nr:porin [Variovorax paradoxus]QFZ83231.1 porin [Variovorax paradoxus]